MCSSGAGTHYRLEKHAERRMEMSIIGLLPFNATTRPTAVSFENIRVEDFCINCHILNCAEPSRRVCETTL